MCHMNKPCFLQHSPSQQGDGCVNGFSNAVQAMKKSIHCFEKGTQGLEADYIKSNDKLNKEYDLSGVCSSTISKK